MWSGRHTASYVNDNSTPFFQRDLDFTCCAWYVCYLICTVLVFKHYLTLSTSKQLYFYLPSINRQSISIRQLIRMVFKMFVTCRISSPFQYQSCLNRFCRHWNLATNKNFRSFRAQASFTRFVLVLWFDRSLPRNRYPSFIVLFCVYLKEKLVQFTSKAFVINFSWMLLTIETKYIYI